MTVPLYNPTETVLSGTHRTYGGQEFAALSDIPTGIPPVPLGDGSAADRAILLAGRCGIAQATVGGNAYPTLTVTTVNDTGVGSFRQALADSKAAGGGYIVWAAGTYVHNFDGATGSGIVMVPSNTTINAWNADVTFTGFGYDDNAGHVSGFYIGGRQSSDFTSYYSSTVCHDVIVTGIKFDCNSGVLDSKGDVLAIRFWAQNIWIDHCYFSNPQKLTDGMVDISYGSSATFSWCDLYRHHKGSLVLGKVITDTPTGNNLPPGVTVANPGIYPVMTVAGVDYVQTRVSYVHTLIDGLAQRSPLASGPAAYAHIDTCWVRIFGNYSDGTNPAVNGLNDWPMTTGTRFSETANPGPSLGPTGAGTSVPGAYVANTGAGSKSDTSAQLLSKNCTYTGMVTTTTSPINTGGGGFSRTSGNTYENCTPQADGTPANVLDPSYLLNTIPAASVKTSLRPAVGRQGGYWSLVGAVTLIPPNVSTDLVPQVIIEAAFNVGADTSSWWTIGDDSRGLIGTFILGPADIYSDITAYTQHLELQAGSSSRVTTPLVEFEAGKATVQLNNVTRAFDPLSTTSPFYFGASTVVVPVPGTLPNAEAATVQVDALDAQVNSQSAANTSAAAAAALVSVTAFAATTTGTTGSSAPTGMLFGASHGAGNGSATISLLAPTIVRTFESNPTTYAGTSMMADIPSGIRQACSFTPDLTVLSDPTAAGYATIVKNIKTVISGLSDIAGHWMAIHHEPVGDAGFTIAQWQQSQVNTRKDILDPVNKTRTHPIWFMNPMNGFILGHKVGGVYQYTATVADQWFSTAVLNAHDAVGFDCYGYDSSPPQDQFDWAHTYAVSKGMSFVVPELGYTISATVGATPDADDLATMKSVIAHVGNYSAATRPYHVCWFNNRGTDLTGLTQSPAYWKNVCINSSVLPDAIGGLAPSDTLFPADTRFPG